MADEQIKIRIQADAEQFKAVSAAVERALADIGKQAEITQGKIKGAGDAVKKSNQQWTNLALVIQDLPYGFRGIQNNLPALVGSIAGATGAIYLAFSSVVAITTAYEKEIVQLIYGITELDRATQSMNKSVANNVGEAKAQIAVDQSLLSIITNVNKSTKERETALTQLKSQYEGNIELQKTDIKDGAKLVEIINKISAALIRKAKAQAFAELIAKQEAKILELQSQAGEEVIKNLGFMKTAYSFLKGGMDGFNASSMVALDAFGEQGTKIKNTTDFLKVLNKALNANTEEQIANNDAATLDDTKPGKPKGGKTEAEKEAERMAAAEKYLADWQIKLNNDIAEAQRKEGDRLAKLREDRLKQEKEDYNNNLSYFDQYYNNLLDFATNDKEAQKQILAEKNNNLLVGLANGTILYDDYIKRIADNTKTLAQITKSISDEAFKSMLQIGNGLMNALGPSFDLLIEKGASLGDVLANAFQSILKQLAKVVATALIAVTLMAILFPGKLAAAGGFGKVFGGLIGQGMGLGGLIGGSSAGATATNTAQGVSNDLIAANNTSSSGGRFTLRGQDLLLSMNRSEKSLNLRRG
jgi:hypothetical protein